MGTVFLFRLPTLRRRKHAPRVISLVVRFCCRAIESGPKQRCTLCHPETANLQEFVAASSFSSTTFQLERSTMFTLRMAFYRALSIWCLSTAGAAGSLNKTYLRTFIFLGSIDILSPGVTTLLAMHAVARTNGSFSQGRGSELVDVNIGGLLDRVADHRYLANESPVGTWHEVLINNGCGFVSEAQYALMGYCTVPGRRPSSEFSVSLRLAGQAQMNVVNFFNNELSQAVGSEFVDLNNDGWLIEWPTMPTTSMELSRGAPLRSK